MTNSVIAWAAWAPAAGATCRGGIMPASRVSDMPNPLSFCAAKLVELASTLPSLAHQILTMRSVANPELDSG
jgi:hypothetical protein